MQTLIVPLSAPEACDANRFGPKAANLADLGQAVVTLDPGLSFGTGQHPTTSFCLEQLVQFWPSPTHS